MSKNAEARDLFTRALRLDAEARDSFLKEACGDDTELRLQVQSMLVDSERADSFFADPDGITLGAEDFDAGSTEVEGDEIGPYTLRQQIGEGGFGTVWMAEQTGALNRMVALKVVKAGMDTKQVLARFEAERQALAMMNHPNIAKVLDAGATPSGRPYFVMELVKGVPITQFCNQQKFGPRQRLELFRDVCAAVNHAHQKGVIHRDLKPSNIMVTLEADRPVVKVIDFGIAKATHSKLTEKTLFTRFEQFLGTPVYMSPEQAAMSNLDVDTRSDIYSLGVLLYELLAGTPPFDQKSLLSAGYDEMRRIIAEDEPPKPSTRCTQTQAQAATAANTSGAKGPKDAFKASAAALKGDLDWIVMKAIEKDRTRRYETANAFSADIGRYLENEPVLAAAPSAAYKFKKFARRNKATIGVAAAMMLLLLAGIAATSWQAVRATDEAERAATEQKLAEGERDRANAAEQLAADRLVESEQAREEAEGVSAFLTGMFASSRPGEVKGGREVKVADVLDRAVEELEANQAIPPARRAKLQKSLADTYQALGLYRDAILLQEQVRDYYETSLGPEHSDTLLAVNDLAGFYQLAGRMDEGLKMAEKVLELRRKVNGPEHSGTVLAMHNLASFYHAAGRLDEGLKMAEKVLELSRKVNGPEHPYTLKAMANLATFYGTAESWDKAIEMQEKALDLHRKVRGAEHPATLIATGNLAAFYCNAGRRDKAIEMLEEMLELSRKVNGPEHPDTLTAMLNLAAIYDQAGQLDEALKMQEEVVALYRKVHGEEHPETRIAMNALGRFYFDAGRLDDAIPIQEEVLALCRKALGDECSETIGAMNNLARSYYSNGSRDKALEMQEEVLMLSRKVHGPAHPETLTVLNNLSVFYSTAGRLDEALETQKEVLEVHRKLHGPEHASTLAVMYNLAGLYGTADRWDEAIPMLEEVLEIQGKLIGPEHPLTVKMTTTLAFASFYHSGTQPEGKVSAIKLLEALPNDPWAVRQLGFFYYDSQPRQTAKAIAAWSKTVRDNPRSYKVQGLLGELLVAEERYEEAVAPLQAARKGLPASDNNYLKCREMLEKALTGLGREDEAQELRQELAELNSKP